MLLSELYTIPFLVIAQHTETFSFDKANFCIDFNVREQCSSTHLSIFTLSSPVSSFRLIPLLSFFILIFLHFEILYYSFNTFYIDG